jgi:hypothetical protein
MFANDDDPARKAEETSAYFADHRLHQSHSLGLDRDQARDAGVKVEDLEADQRLQDAVLTVHHAAFHTFSGPAVKIIENHLGRGFFKLEQVQAQGLQVQLPVMAPRAEVKSAYRRCHPRRPHLRQQGRHEHISEATKDALEG